MTKKCTECNKSKLIDQFYRNINVKDGYLNQCKKCVLKKEKVFRENNKEKISQQGKRWRENNKEIKKKMDKKYSQTEQGKKSHRKSRLKWIKNNPEKNIEAKRKWKKNNKEWRKEYYERTKEKQIQKNLERRRNSIHLRLRHRVSGLIRHRLKKRLSSKEGKSTFDFLPYTLEELIKHLEKQFTKGMTWDNYGKWHIDHIRPDCSFNYKSVEDKEFQECWALKNLQPLWAKDNWSKNKYD